MTIKQTPILFSTPMVSALLDGRKTQTRRIVKWPASIGGAPSAESLDNLGDCVTVVVRGKHFVTCPYGSTGDLLWVREAWRPTGVSHQEWVSVLFRADEHHIDRPYFKVNLARQGWRPGIHLPRVAARLELKLSEPPSLQRLLAITDEEAIAEGIEKYDRALFGLPRWPLERLKPTAREAFLSLFREINGLDLRQDPWVWSLRFSIASASPRILRDNS